MAVDKIFSPNSPFERWRFPLWQAERWVERGEATMENGQLIFKDAFSLMIQRSYRREEMQMKADQSYERMVDMEQSGGRTTKPSVMVLKIKNSGTMPMLQMQRKWPMGTFSTP